jgi:hypothetical protein
MQAKHKNTGRWEGAGRVLIKQNTGHSDTAATAAVNPEPSGSGSEAAAAVCRASRMGRGRGQRRCPKVTECPISHNAESRENGLYRIYMPEEGLQTSSTYIRALRFCV